MPNRIDETFTRLRNKKRAAFIPYICAGDPSLAATEQIALALIAAGADVLELGVPFSDPLADGIVNQRASQRALDAGADVRGVLATVRAIRAKTETPIVLYTYMNPIFQFGWEAFHKAAAQSGVDGLLILDLPPDEDIEPVSEVHHIRLVAPTTDADRLARIVRDARGFIYYVSREGVTGSGPSVSGSVEAKLSAIRSATSLPIAVGFGISTPEQAADIARLADGVVVGSAIVKEIEQRGREETFSRDIGAFAKAFADAIHAREAN